MATTIPIVIVTAFHAGTSQRCSRSRSHSRGGGGGGGGGQMKMMMMIYHHASHYPPTQLEPHAHSWSKDSIVDRLTSTPSSVEHGMVVTLKMTCRFRTNFQK